MSGVSDAAETQPKHVQHLDRAKARADIQFLGFCLDERKKVHVTSHVKRSKIQLRRRSWRWCGWPAANEKSFLKYLSIFPSFIRVQFSFSSLAEADTRNKAEEENFPPNFVIFPAIVVFHWLLDVLQSERVNKLAGLPRESSLSEEIWSAEYSCEVNN